MWKGYIEKVAVEQHSVGWLIKADRTLKKHRVIYRVLGRLMGETDLAGAPVRAGRKAESRQDRGKHKFNVEPGGSLATEWIMKLER